jgi:hypothetical protein
MRRVSSRQRLVSWDAFDATADDVGSDVASVTEDDFHSAVLDIDSPISTTEVGRKRDRSTMRKSDSAGSVGANSLLKQFSSPKSVEASVNIMRSSDGGPAMDAGTFPPTRLEVPTLIAGEPWEIDYASFNLNLGSNNNNLFHLKNSTSTNTLSSFLSTCSTLPTEQLSFDKLMKDMHVAVFAFLDLESLRNIMAVNRSYRGLVLSKDAHSSLWQGHCDEKWKVHPKTTSGDSAPLEYVDSFRLPTAAAALNESNFNLPLLLKMTPAEYPTGVDEDLVQAQNERTERLRPNLPLGARGLRLQPANHPPAEDGLPGYVRLYKDSMGRSLVRYTGPIGAGDRCIRSNHALPRPQLQNENVANDTGSHFGSTSNGSSRQSFMDLLRRGPNRLLHNRNTRNGSNASNSSSVSSAHPASSWKPFVMPFVENSSTVNVTPRLISYYEVSILPAPRPNEERDDDSIPGTAALVAAPRPSRSDCVAVGLATSSFHVHTRMPGWDRQSFGFHGDDAGIFHASGGMVKEFGSKFGQGDTIGCGVDYVNKGIFLTLNGQYLGYGWKGIEDEFLKNDLFPVVGLDSNCPLYFNFGQEEPFQFDLSKFIMKHESIIASQYSLEETKSPPKHVDSATLLRSLSSCSSMASLASTSSCTPSRRSRSRLSKRRGARDRK